MACHCLGDPAVQHDDIDGPFNAECSVILAQFERKVTAERASATRSPLQSARACGSEEWFRSRELPLEWDPQFEAPGLGLI